MVRMWLGSTWLLSAFLLSEVGPFVLDTVDRVVRTVSSSCAGVTTGFFWLVAFELSRTLVIQRPTGVMTSGR